MAELVCITGMDGTGKNTLINKIASGTAPVYVANIWDLMDLEGAKLGFTSKKHIDDYLCELSPDSRLLFLAHALKYSVDKSIGSTAKTIILNAYYYKYFASELALGASPGLVQSLINGFPKPGKIFILELNAEKAAERKQKFSRYECGLSSQPDKNSFIEFQKKAAKYWSAFDLAVAARLNASLEPDQVYAGYLKATKEK